MPQLPPSLTQLTQHRWLRHAAAASFLLALAWVASRPLPAPPASLTAPAPVSSPPQQAAFASPALLPASGEVAASPRLVELADGRLAASWLAGPGDPGAIGVWFSTLDNTGWREPARIIDLPGTAGQLLAHLETLDDLQLAAHGDTLSLWLSARGIGGGRGSQVIRLHSPDAGERWTAARRIDHAPLGSQALVPPLAISDGSHWLAVGQAGNIDLLLLDARQRVRARQRLAHGSDSRLAWLALDTRHIIALRRDGAGNDYGSSQDGGRQWTWQRASGLPVGSHPFALLRLHDGELLLAGAGAQGENSLHLWRSTDDGAHWTLARTLEEAADGAARFSAPSLLQGRDGRLHLAYAWRGQRIKYLNFNQAWLREEAR